MKDNEELVLRVRNMLANHVMEDLFNDTRAIVDKYGFDGAECQFKWRLQLLRYMREADTLRGGDDDFGDEF